MKAQTKKIYILSGKFSLKEELSIISPVYQAQDIIEELVRQIDQSAQKITAEFEIILVDDDSQDQSWEKIKDIARRYPHLKGIKLSRNFGQHNAIAAGLWHARGRYLVVMDCDLQDDPAYIKDLYDKVKEGCDIVYTIRKKRRHGVFKNYFASIFHRLFNYLVGNHYVKTNNKIGTYSIITRKVAEAYKKLHDEYRPYLVMLNILGFKQAYIGVEHTKRYQGKSSYGIKKLIRHGLNAVISQTDRLLQVAIYIGLIYMIFSFGFSAFVFIRALLYGYYPGWASLVILISLSTGIILLSLGIVGLYIGKIFTQVKQRPVFLVDEKINFQESN